MLCVSHRNAHCTAEMTQRTGRFLLSEVAEFPACNRYQRYKILICIRKLKTAKEKKKI